MATQLDSVSIYSYRIMGRESYRLILLLLLNTPFSCSEDNHHDEISPICTHRYEYRNMKETQHETCEQIRSRNPVCTDTLKVAFSSQPPYIFVDEHGDVTGILQGRLVFYIYLSIFDVPMRRIR